MSLSQVRDYIQERMLVVEPDFTEWTQSLDVETKNIPRTKLDKVYHLTYQPISSTIKVDRHVDDSFPILMSIFRIGGDTPVEVRDELLDVAHCIRMDLIDWRNIGDFKIANDNQLDDVNVLSITPTQIDDTNDNTIRVDIEITARLLFGV